MKYYYNKWFLITFLLTCILAFGLISSNKANALTGAQWQPGYIIDDSLFFNREGMSAQDIQTFLSSKMPNCDTSGTNVYSGSTTRAQYGSSRGYPPPYTCLKDYVQNITPSTPDTYCNYGVSGGTKSAAMIISEVSWACGINPQVLLILLQKEQSFITDDWPWSIQYAKATGYGCPDSDLSSNVDGNNNGCYDEFEGFFRQVFYAARQYQKYVKLSDQFNFAAGRTSNILWHPNSNCGGSSVYIQNKATAALYNYTPYQPNTAALYNLYGAGDGCSSYGNRNFWRMYNDWFGPTMGSLVKIANDKTVYLLNDTKAHPIYDSNVLNDLALLGPVREVTSNEINSHYAGSPLTRMIGVDGGSTLYLINASIKLPFSSCSQVADYGFNCSNVVKLSPLLVNKLVNGPAVSSTLKSNSSPNIYFMDNGKKRPIPSVSDLQKLNFPHTNVFTNDLVSSQDNGLPLYGPSSLVKTANSPSVYIVKDTDTLLPVNSFTFTEELGLGKSVRTISSNYNVGANVKNKIKCGSVNYLAINGTLYTVSSGMMTTYGFNSNDFIDGGLICSNVKKSSQGLTEYARTSNGNIYHIENGQKRLFTSLNNFNSPSYCNNTCKYINVSDYFASTFPNGINI